MLHTGAKKSMSDFEKMVSAGQGLWSSEISTIQVNLGLQCNQSCAHCHLEASPHRTETMAWPVMERVMVACRKARCSQVDLTGGAPELNPHFKRFVTALYGEGLAVQVRTNLTVLTEPGMEILPEFLHAKRVRLVASMPCYLEENVRAQRGADVYAKSIAAIKRLNALGYGSDPDLILNLVYNPGGPFLPPDQGELEATYRSELKRRFGITFTRLLTITNMPIGRFRSQLRREGKEEEYHYLLKHAFNPGTVSSLMCRHQISIGWDGRLYDCDFNLALKLPVNHGSPDHIDSFDAANLIVRRIVIGDHCFGCTAGHGSSCAGALT